MNFNLKDDDIVLLADKFPVAKHHILALPRKHIDNAKTVKPEDAKLSKF